MKLELITIFDRSGSMESLAEDVVGGYNTLIKEQKALPGEVRVTLIQFNHAVDVLYQGVPIQYLAPLTPDSYKPSGSTALFDAIGQTLTAQGARIGGDCWADKVLVNIVTDGENNCSREFTLAQVRAMIEQKEKGAGWTILYQAAGLDAFAEGAQLGISGATTRGVTADAKGIAEAYGNISTFATTLRTEA